MKLCKEFCKESFNIKLVFNSFKIKNYFSYKDPIPNDLKSFLVCKFTWASCSSSYIGETCHHFKIRIEEHIKKDNKSHIFKYLYSTATCFDSCNCFCFKIIDKANSKFNSFSSHPFPVASVPLAPFCLCLFFFCCYLQFSFIYCFHYIYASFTIGIFYCLNYTLLLLHNTPSDRFYNTCVINMS